MDTLKQSIILFDLDGTLTDSEEGIIRSTQYMQEKMGQRIWSAEELHFIVGPPLIQSFTKEFGMAQEMAEKVASTLFGDIFDLVAGKREGYKTKPDPALTLFVMDSLGVSPSECALAGDSGMDMAAAVNAGALPIGVLWGFRTAEELQKNGAEYLFSSPAEITDLIGKLNG